MIDKPIFLSSLIVIAGPCGVGKSTLIKRLRNNNLASLNQLVESELSEFSVLHFQNAKSIQKIKKDKLIVHYDLSRFENRSPYLPLKDLIKNSKSTIIVTLYAPRFILQKRMNKRFKTALRKLLRSPSRKQLDKVRRWSKRQYRNKAHISLIYDKWSSFVEDLRIEHYFLETSGLSDDSLKAYDSSLIEGMH